LPREPQELAKPAETERAAYYSSEQKFVPVGNLHEAI
jgi:hypothetical protein